MGHDIYAYPAPEAEDRVAYLRRSMSSEDAHDVYKYLSAEQYDGGVSGLGDWVFFEEGGLALALNKAVENHAEQDIIDFLEAAHRQAIESLYGVLIFFG